MIVVDTSALMAIILDDDKAQECSDVIAETSNISISAGTLAEALIVAGRRHVVDEMRRLIDGLGFRVVPVAQADATRIAEAYSRWGKGIHPAGLNYGDCFAYALAHLYKCPLLFVGDDFTKTDLVACI